MPPPDGPPRRRSRAIGSLLIGLWGAVVVISTGMLNSYASRPAASADAPRTWPDGAALPRATDRWTLLLFLHPHCSCSGATVQELDRILAHTRDRVEVHVAFFRPADAGADWCRTGLWDHAARLPQTALHEDVDGALARVFDAHASGQALLYDAAGILHYQGGITGSRGHAGDNAGADAIVAHVRGSEGCGAAPVFGCDLIGEEQP